METKQTAVEWLLEQTMYMRSTKWPDIVEQALEMEKEQIIYAYQAGDGDAYNLEETEGWAEQYYRETYGK